MRSEITGQRPAVNAQGAEIADGKNGMGSFRFLLPLLVLGVLWFTLINHLRVEWTLNPQYNYGWAVPPFCAYLVWRSIRMELKDQSSGTRDEHSKGSSGSGSLQPRGASFYLLFAGLCLLYFPTRLIQ